MNRIPVLKKGLWTPNAKSVNSAFNGIKDYILIPAPDLEGRPDSDGHGVGDREQDKGQGLDIKVQLIDFWEINPESVYWVEILKDFWFFENR